MPMPKKTAVQHLLSGYYRPSRHGPLPGRFIDPERQASAPEPTPADSVWKHELRLPGPGETMEDVWRKAMEYRDKRRREGLKAYPEDDEPESS